MGIERVRNMTTLDQIILIIAIGIITMAFFVSVFFRLHRLKCRVDCNKGILYNIKSPLMIMPSSFYIPLVLILNN